MYSPEPKESRESGNLLPDLSGEDGKGISDMLCQLKVKAEYCRSRTNSYDPNGIDKAIVSCLNHPTLREHFVIETTVGEGGFGTVYKVRHKTDKQFYALKLIPLYEEDNIDKLNREVELLAAMKHENIVGYNTSWIVSCKNNNDPGPRALSEEQDDSSLSSIYDDASWTGKFLCIQMQFCPQTLQDFIDKGELHGNPEDVTRILKEILAGVKYIHNKDIMHRDLKPKNIFLDHLGHVKIGDFGFARHRHSHHLTMDLLNINDEENETCSSLTEELGTTLYRAPELERDTGSSYWKEVDLYSLGIVIFEMVYPFKTGSERIDVLRGLRKSAVYFPLDFSYPAVPSIQHFIVELLQHNPVKRLKISEMVKLLSQYEPAVNEEGENSNENADEQKGRSRRRSGNADTRRALKSISEGVGRVHWTRRSSSMCLNMGSGLILTAAVGQKTKKGLSCTASFGNPNGKIKLKLDQRNITWMGSGSRSVLFQFDSRWSSSAIHIPKFEIYTQDLFLNNQSQRNVYVYQRTSKKFVGACLNKLSTLPELNESLVPYVETLGSESNAICFTNVTTTQSNIGAPVVTLDVDSGDTQPRPKLCGLVIGSFYVEGQKIGSLVLSMRGIYQWQDQPIPAPIRQQMFSNTFYSSCYDELIGAYLKLKTENERLLMK